MTLEVDIKKTFGSYSLDVSFKAEDEVFGLLGASGCGKSLTALSLFKDHPEVRIAYIFQNPMESLNPVMKIGAQIHETRKGLSREEIVDLLHIGKRTASRLLRMMVAERSLVLLPRTKRYALPEPAAKTEAFLFR